MSQPIEHSPWPWREEYWRFEINQMVWCIADADGRTVVEGNPYDSKPLDGDGKLLAAAPTMYRIIRQICHTDWQCREQGLRSAQYLLQELEGKPDAEG